MISEKDLVRALVELIRKAETSLPKDVEEKLKEAYKNEKNPLAKIQLEQVLKNTKLARERQLPICQDTGILSFYLKIGEKANSDVSLIKKAIQEAVKIATEKIPLRENTVDPFTRKNSGNNLGLRMPLIHLEFFPGNYLKITLMAKGAGSENMSSLKVLKPTDGKKEIKKFVLEKVAEAGGQPCPPIILGIGVGGSSEQAMKLAKLSLLRPLNESIKDKKIAQLEREILHEVNELGIGTMGLGGSTTCLGVNIMIAATHTASLPVAINFGCWATRRATVKISTNGEVKFL